MTFPPEIEVGDELSDYLTSVQYKAHGATTRAANFILSNNNRIYTLVISDAVPSTL